jgi:hypothetical protein
MVVEFTFEDDCDIQSRASVTTQDSNLKHSNSTAEERGVRNVKDEGGYVIICRSVYQRNE